MHAKHKVVLALLYSGALATSQAGQVTYNFDTDPAGVVNVVGSNPDVPRWQNKGGNPDSGGFLAITFAQTYFNTGILFPDLDPGKVVTAFTFDCDLRVGNPSTGDRAADGFSISFARAGDPVLESWDADPLRGFRGDSASGGCSGCEAAALPETGTMTGIAVSFDTWAGNTLPDGADVEGIVVVVDNVTVLRQAMPTRNGACTDGTSLQTGAREAAYWTGAGDPTLPESWKTLCWQPLHVELDDVGKLTVAWKGVTILDKYQTTYFPTPGRLVFAGRTGGSTEQTHVDNIKLTTTAVAGESQAPSVPANVKATETGARRVALEWGASVDAPDPQVRVAYELQRDGATIVQRLTGTNYEDRVNLQPSSAHTYQVRAVDLNSNKSAWAPVTVTTVAEVPIQGWLTGQIYDNLNGASMDDLMAALSDPKYPSKPDRVSLALRGLSFGEPAFGDTYGENHLFRVTGTLTVPQTGSYRFFVRSDDASGFYLNTSGTSAPNPSTTTPVAQETDCCDAFQEPGVANDDGTTFPTSDPISLTAGQKLGFIWLVKEGGGGDWGQVAWRMEGDATAAGSLAPIPGSFVEPSGTSDPVGASVTISKDPVDATIIANEPVTFTADATFKSPWTTTPVYQWFKNGTPMLGEGKSWTLRVPAVADNGAKIKFLASVPGAQAMSKEVTLTVTADTKPPTVAAMHGSDDFTKATVVFSEPVTDPTATTAGNYTFSGGLTASAAARVDPYTVRLTTSKQTPDTHYTLTVANVKDNAGNAVAANTTYDFRTYVLATGFLKFEVWSGMDSGTSVDLLTNYVNYPNSPNMATVTTAFDTRPVYPDDTHEQYGGRLSGWLVPTETSDYTFFISSDDASELWLSTDDTPAKLALVAQETDCCEGFVEPGTLNDDATTSTTSNPIHLVAGNKYWVQALWKEGGGGDYCQVAWRKAGDTTAAGSLTPISGQYLAYYTEPGSGAASFTSVAISGGNLVIAWTGGTLDSADAVEGPWVAVPNAQSPASFPITGAKKFYRVR